MRVDGLDRWGRGRLLAAGIVSGALPWLPGLVAVALAYTLFAAGWATAGPAQDALLSDLAPAGGRGRLFGWKEAAASLGASLGPLVGGALYDHVAEEAAFVLNGLLLLTAAALAARWFGWTTSAAPGR
jgi:MFS family permease